MDDVLDEITALQREDIRLELGADGLRLNNVATALFGRFQRLGKMEDLEEAIAYHRRALNLRPPGHPNRSSSLGNLAGAVFTRFTQLGKMEDLEEAIAHNYHALALCPPGHPDRSTSLNNLAGAVSTRFTQLGKMEDLEEAITYHRQALDLYPPGHPNRSTSLNNLAGAVFTRFTQLGKMEDLEEAIACQHQALDLFPPGHPHCSLSLSNLANALATRFEQLGQMEDLEEAIAHNYHALALCPPGHPNRSSSLNNLAGAVFTRFTQLGKMEDLEEAITYHRQALDLYPPGHPNRSTSLNNLAGAVFTRFTQLGKMEDLEEAIAYHRQVLDLRPPGHPNRSSSLNNLGDAVFTRFEQLGKMEDLEEAIAYHRRALNLRPPGHPNRSSSLNSLGDAVFTRFEQLGKMEDLEEAIACQHQALGLFPPGHPHCSLALNSLAKAVYTRFEQLGQMEELEEAIAYHRQALDLRPPGHPNRSSSLGNLAGAVFTRFEQLGTIQDLEESMKLSSDADTILPSSHPDHATTRSKLASRTLRLFHHSPSSDRPPHIISDSFALFESASHHSASRAQDRFFAALLWVQDARRYKHSSILNAYSTALTCLDRSVTVTPTVQSWQKSLAKVPRSLASDAASSAIEADHLETAVELLEQGRTMLWSKMRGYRHSLDKLRDVNGNLANEFDRVSRELEHRAISSDVDSVLPDFYDRQARTHRILSEKWDVLVGQIRQLDGFTNFLQAIPFTNLRLAATEGPVIIVNVSQFRSDAIILLMSHPPVLLCLPDASPDALRKLSETLSLSLGLGSNSSSIIVILRELWDLVVSPVVDRLAILGVTENSRIWWCPTAALCALPLHAAGPYMPGLKNLPDIYISSYTPSLSSLIRARSDLVGKLTGPKLFVVGQPNDHLPHARLPQVREEIRRIQILDPSVNVLLGEQANRETILQCLQQYPWVHFACHGHRSPAAPFLSYFLLHDDQRLTLVDLVQARLPNADLAFLSACHSAAININNTPDEGIHLAAALQFCGFRSVVGTLWAMADIDGPDVAEGFYRYMFEQGAGGDFRDAAAALNHATRAMRRRRVPVDRWINFVHIGA